MSEQTHTPKGIDFIPEEAGLLLQLTPQQYEPSLPKDPVERDLTVLASNVALVANYMNRSLKVIGNGVSSVVPMYTPHDQFKVIRISDPEGESEIRFYPLLKDTPEKVLDVTLKRTGSQKREPIGLQDVPSSHWVTLAGANKVVREEVAARHSRRGWFTRKLLGG